jgi:hypothetical protein
LFGIISILDMKSCVRKTCIVLMIFPTRTRSSVCTVVNSFSMSRFMTFVAPGIIDNICDVWARTVEMSAMCKRACKRIRGLHGMRLCLCFITHQITKTHFVFSGINIYDNRCMYLYKPLGYFAYTLSTKWAEPRPRLSRSQLKCC